MEKEPRKRSSIGLVGMIVILLSIVLGSFLDNPFILISGIVLGVFILLTAVIVDRLDNIIYLLRQIEEYSKSNTQEK
ncbi:MAG: hypothetical protein K1V80_03095 [Muribaculaceae bacterium]|uniref:hypothetical protein n=1 Tax=uncultured Muribaculum sp. TaxID=1918613 RepID=UPI0026EDBBA5|nr:hypothetical protein [uncultured Muribaculum sp.]